ncbi:MAG: tRNA 4-thiouridine(8) synthase ThiI [Thermoproteota archaeon]|nr:MAG: tRNA 4-thiouridine(8) synthase ThiI [Candidatus Korarchaeota archaeon]
MRLVKNAVLVRYSEIGLKSRRTRREMERLLMENVRESLMSRGISIASVVKKASRIVAYTVDERAPCVISKVFGVRSVSHAVELPADLETLKRAAIELASGSSGSFAVRVQRVTKEFPLTSTEVARVVGGAVKASTGRPVDLSSPDQTIFIEIIGDMAYLFDSKVEGPGGLPLGSQGSAVALVSGGIDSPVAAWMVMRRGVSVRPVHMRLTEEGEEQFLRAVSALEEYSPRSLDPLVVDHRETLEEVAARLRDAGAPEWTCIFCKRLMLLEAARTAERLRASAVVTGESIGQVASQTLANMAVISRGIDALVLRPLVGMNKEDIVRLAERIGVMAGYRPVECPLRPARVITGASWDRFVWVAREAGLSSLAGVES